MDWEGVDTCSICTEPFDKNLRPRNLPCGHTFCTVCITNGIQDGNIECPNCKGPHQASSANDFPVCYIAEALLSKIKELTPAEDVGSKDDEGSSELENSSIHTDVIANELLESVKDVLESMKATEAEAEHLRAFLYERKTKHRDLIKNIRYMVHDNENAIKGLDKDDEKVVRILKEGRKYREEVNSVMQKINNATEDSETSSLSNELERLHDMLVGWNMRCKKQLPNTASLKESRKIVAKTKASLRQYKKDVADNTNNIDLTDMGLSITDKRKIFEDSISSNALSKMLTSRKTNFSKLAVCAVKEIKGCVRTAKFSFKDGRAYVHCLKEGGPPLNALIIQYDELTESLNKDSVVAFMELEWGGSIKGRIHILLSPKTFLATQFWKGCMKEEGFNYLTTTFDEQIQNYSYKYIVGRNYERPVSKSVEVMGSRQLEPGSVRSGDYLKTFQIFLEGSGSDMKIFGQVQEGMEVLREAEKSGNIGKVQIADSGIVMPGTFCTF